MKRKWFVLIVGLFALSLLMKSAYAQPSAPTLTVSRSGQTINFQWTTDPTALGYNLYYADFYNPVSIGSLDMGTDSQLSVTLPNNSAFYVAVKASDGAGESDFSNIVSVKGKNSVTSSVSEQTFTMTELGVTAYPEPYDQVYKVMPFYIESYNADLDNDGDSDTILAFGTYAFEKSQEVPYMPVILENMGDGTFKKLNIIGQYVTQTHPREISVADFNLDGRLDIVIIGSGYDGPDNQTAGFGDQNIILMSNADGTYIDASALIPQEKEYTHSVTTGDVNGDGYPEIFVGEISANPYLLVNSYGEGFTKKEMPDSIFTYWTKEYNPHTTCLLADTDNDNILELILGVTGQELLGGNSIILDQDGNGNFDDTASVELPVGLFGNGTINVDIDAADITGDGLEDILMTQTPSDPFYKGRGFQVLIQQIDGSFIDETVTRISGVDINEERGWIFFAAFVDGDGDGDLDIEMAPRQFENEIFIMANDGAGQFMYDDDPNVDESKYDYHNYVSFDHQTGDVFMCTYDFSDFQQTGVNNGNATLTIKQLDQTK